MGSVIQATGTVDLRMARGRESSLEAAGALVAAAPILGSISNPPEVWVGCGCHKDSISGQIPTCLVLRIGGIKLQLLCGVMIELA